MRGVGCALAAILLSGCAGSSGNVDYPAYTSQYLDVHKDEGADRVVVDDVRMTRAWNYIQLKASKATVHAAVNAHASKAVHHAVLQPANAFVILSEPAANIKDHDHLSFCAASGALAAVTIVIGDSGSNEELVAVTFDSIAACS